ncbi:hypothetical protein Pan216_49340 [Planctomycetes bacterium Pan216]|uniref:HEAT repeat protein n=1 Tax=Kolteria novifilia TaxID=2527975 RepID=A0A518BAP2_9BACT|nr:hypothetical protein Pan216_49340 [Planctomycetes bacterium Pan216]
MNSANNPIERCLTILAEAIRRPCRRTVGGFSALAVCLVLATFAQAQDESSGPSERQDRPVRNRAVIESLKIQKDLSRSAAKPTGREYDTFDDMRQRKIAADPALIDKVAKYHVYKLTDPNELADLTRHADLIMRDVRGASVAGNSKQLSVEFLKAYKASLFKYLKDLTDNNFVVRINALVLIERLYDPKSVNIHDGVPILLEVLGDKKQEEAVRYLALSGLDAAKEVGQARVVDERKAVNAILDMASEPDVQEVTLEQLVTTLGNLERPHRGDIAERAEVGKFLADTALDTNMPARVRVAAGISLGKLQTSGIRGWNFRLQSVVMGKALQALIDAHTAVFINDEKYRHLALRLGLAIGAMKREMADNTSVSEEEKKDVTEFTQIAFAVITQIIDRADVNIDPLQEWLKKNDNPQQKRLAPRAGDLVMIGQKPAG